MSPRDPSRWLLEVHVDPRWFELRRCPVPMPAPGQPVARALEGDVLLLGRGPAVDDGQGLDLSPDVAISRRHAQLERRGDTWWVLDLASHNGTWVSHDAQLLPASPIQEATELADGSSVLLGGWTRLVLRRTGGSGGWAGLLR